MLKLGGVVILILPKNDSIKYLVGNSNMEFKCLPLTPYSDIACELLNALSTSLLSNIEAKKYPDVISFGFWCRRGNIEKLKEEYKEKLIRLGRGITFHITPSNVPVNFAFSFAFSLLAGNGNIVRVPSKGFAQIDIICEAIGELFKYIKFKRIADMTAFIKYEHIDEITAEISKQCNSRIIWGGDNTINAIKKFPIPERSIDVAFVDRYSFCVIDAESINRADIGELKRLSEGFYNDTYLMDQNACSSPNLLIWLGKGQNIEIAKKKFWNGIYEITSEKYELQPVYAVDKYTQLCQNAIDFEFVSSCVKYGNYIYCVNLRDIPSDVCNLRGKCGYFYEYDTNDINNVAHIVDTKYQTLTYFGIGKSELANFVLENSLMGIDRIVPIGSAMDISVMWDGYDLVRMLSRVIDIK